MEIPSKLRLVLQHEHTPPSTMALFGLLPNTLPPAVIAIVSILVLLHIVAFISLSNAVVCSCGRVLCDVSAVQSCVHLDDCLVVFAHCMDCEGDGRVKE